jgi:hypothetical protein
MILETTYEFRIALCREKREPTSGLEPLTCSSYE